MKWKHRKRNVVNEVNIPISVGSCVKLCALREKERADQEISIIRIATTKRYFKLLNDAMLLGTSVNKFHPRASHAFNLMLKCHMIHC